ncbi:hypothetical protein [[Mycobacterium] burgundiense]|uniref:Uncharacterized protein n=1 Tax=[Mycobacterium] burgundiense TaxID=3064286 RepID=A0ABM9LHK5_9MYCO|nr:hypothetical protein [Mycolicibacterium sp. MU0053]CAJ1499140.1 hypothetical protein MU0053_001337 [Mycolicibacterium sp. MU0053]
MFALARCGSMPVRRDRTTATVPIAAEAPIDPVEAASTQSADHPLQDVLAMEMISVCDALATQARCTLQLHR